MEEYPPLQSDFEWLVKSWTAFRASSEIITISILQFDLVWFGLVWIHLNMIGSDQKCADVVTIENCCCGLH